MKELLAENPDSCLFKPSELVKDPLKFVILSVSSGWTPTIVTSFMNMPDLRAEVKNFSVLQQILLSSSHCFLC